MWGQRLHYLVLSLLQLGLNHLQAVLKTHRLLISRLHTKIIDIRTEEAEEEEEQEEAERVYMLRPVSKTNDMCQDNWVLAKRSCQ